MDRTYSAALASGDAIFTSTVSPEEAPVQYLVNGCNPEVFEFDVEEGRWTRLRMLLNAHEYNVIVELVDTDPGSALSPPTLMLLAKDGVYLSDAPRPLGSNRLFFSISSHVDVLVYAPPGSAGQHRYELVANNAGDNVFKHHLGYINVVASNNPTQSIDLFSTTFDLCR